MLHGERDVRVADALAQRLPVELRVAARGGVAVPDVVQVDLREIGRRRQLLEPPRDRIGMRRPSVLPAEQHPVIVVVRAEVAALLVKSGASRFRWRARRRALRWDARPARACRRRSVRADQSRLSGVQTGCFLGVVAAHLRGG